MTSFKRALPVFGAVLFGAVTSTPTMAANEWTQLMYLERIISHPGGGATLFLPASNPACGSSGNQFNFSIGQNGLTSDGAKQGFALVMVAYSLGKPLRVLFDPAILGCPIQQVMLEP